MRSRHDARRWLAVLARMSLHPNGSSLLMPFDSPSSPKYAQHLGSSASQADANRRPQRGRRGCSERGLSAQAAQSAYLAVNQSGIGSHGDDMEVRLKTLPRPTGDEIRVIVTEYDLPRRSTQPHDVTVDAEGMVWFEDFGDNWVGRLNPKTGEVKEWPIPATRPFPPFHPGSLDIALDRGWQPVARHDATGLGGEIRQEDREGDDVQPAARSINSSDPPPSWSLPRAAGDVWVGEADARRRSCKRMVKPRPCTCSIRRPADEKLSGALRRLRVGGAAEWQCDGVLAPR